MNSYTFYRYGDKTAKSIPGRVIAIIWILCGITITCIFTATLTTALSTDQIVKAFDIRGTEVRIDTITFDHANKNITVCELFRVNFQGQTLSTIGYHWE